MSIKTRADDPRPSTWFGKMVAGGPRTTFLIVLVVLTSSSRADNWPAWRGDSAGSGITKETDLPLEWDQGTNVAWKTANLPKKTS